MSKSLKTTKGSTSTIYEKVKKESQKEKISILDDIDFELELIHRDRINRAYILKLLKDFKAGKRAE